MDITHENEMNGDYFEAGFSNQNQGSRIIQRSSTA
jgi:hypothetical protein